ncbi:MAG TPA: DUF429 domain-containing protein [Thermoanaerobaculia bacterium]|nr:DUF429 domain-containing protein [Thermoanaerobaculia bacterium]
MSIIAGVDGCPSGWIVVRRRLDWGEIETVAVESIEELFDGVLKPAVVAIDIPIGLTESGPRAADVEVRSALGAKRASSVFPAAIRPLLELTTYTEATATSRKIQGKGISKQGFAIYPKIREVDGLLQRRPSLRRRLVEIHPELSFCHWNCGAPIVPGKRTAKGAAIRRDLIDRYFGPGAFPAVRGAHRKNDVADDDIADAFAALWTAERIERGTSIIYPTDPPLDTTGLPMRIVA